MSLLVAVLRHWLRKEEDCPHVLVSTHFHSLIQQKLLPDSKLIEYLVSFSSYFIGVLCTGDWEVEFLCKDVFVFFFAKYMHYHLKF